MITKLLVWFGTCMLAGEVFSTNDKQGPYELLMKSFEDCGDEHTLAKFNTKWRKTSRTMVTIEGTFMTNITVDNDIKLRSVMQILTPNGWKDNFMNFDFGDMGACDLVNRYFDAKDVQRLVDGIIYEDGTKLERFCNLQPGEYTINPFEFRVETFKGFPNFFYGKYRTKSTMFYKDFNGHEIACTWCYFDIVKKSNKRG